MKKIFITSIATLGVTGLVGGGTFAAFSDQYQIDNNTVGADILELVVEEESPATPFDELGSLSPGEEMVQKFWLASRNGMAPNATLTLNLINLESFEDGCKGGESDVDPDCSSLGGGLRTSYTVPGAAKGEFDESAWMYIHKSAPFTPDDALPIGDQCDEAIANVGEWGVGNIRTAVLGGGAGSFSLTDDTSPLGPGEGICVEISVRLPGTATNAVQGDWSVFDARFDLEQVPTRSS